MPRASEVAAALGCPLRGADVTIATPCAVDDAGPGALVFLSRANEATLARLNSIEEVACVTSADIAESLNCATIVHDDPRLGFCLALSRFFPEPAPTGVADAGVDAKARLAESVSTAGGARIGPDVTIGAGTRVADGMIIRGFALSKNGRFFFNYSMRKDGVTPIRFCARSRFGMASSNWAAGLDIAGSLPICA